LVVFRNFNLEIEAARTLALIGPSGCGKTTLLNMLAFLEPADEGVVSYDSRECAFGNPATPAIGYLFQRDALLPWRTALGNALLGLECQERVTPETRQLATDYFERFGLAGFEEAWPYTLSGGQRQRVALIQSLLVDPEILLLDEPFGSVDYQTKLQLEEELLGVVRTPNGSGDRKTVVFVTHDIEEAITLGDRVVVLGHPPSEILLDLPVDLEESLRTPLAARHSSIMKSLFTQIWAELRGSAPNSITGNHAVTPS